MGIIALLNFIDRPKPNPNALGCPCYLRSPLPMPPGVRFHPPFVPLKPSVHWALPSEFGPTESRGPVLQNHSEVAKVTRRLSLTARIFGRCSRDTLRRE